MGRKPPRTTTYRPTPTAPTIYQSVIPEEDFQLARDYTQQLKDERAQKKAAREAIGYGDAAMAERQKLRAEREKTKYERSLPKTSLKSPTVQSNTGTTP